ncbi:hypothetical protein Droror1_Dr00009978 [Drosera rotundifolia]
MSPPPPEDSGPNFWGPTPDPATYYATNSIRHHSFYFPTSTGQTLFTQRFLPKSHPIKSLIFATHGYGSDSGWKFQSICIAFAQWGHAVFAADLVGHGRSSGVRGYSGDMEMVAATAREWMETVRGDERWRGVPGFLFGESMGGAVTMLIYLQSKPDMWTGLIFSAPLFVIPEDMKPSKLRLFMYGLLFGLADTWAVLPDSKMVGKAIKDPEKLKIIAANPRRYKGNPRVGTMRELVRVTEYIQNNFDKVTVPFLTVHGTDDVVTCPSSSKLLYEKASSTDKTLKLYEGMYHSLIQGEPDKNVSIVLGDMRAWIDERVERYGDGKTVSVDD